MPGKSLAVLMSSIIVLFGATACGSDKSGDSAESTASPESQFVKVTKTTGTSDDKQVKLGCADGYQPFDVKVPWAVREDDDYTQSDDFDFFDMKGTVESDGFYVPRDAETDDYDGGYFQSQVRLEMSLSDDVDVSAVIIHPAAHKGDDQAITSVVHEGNVQLSLETENYVQNEFVGSPDRIDSLTLCATLTD